MDTASALWLARLQELLSAAMAVRAALDELEAVTPAQIAALQARGAAELTVTAAHAG